MPVSPKFASTAIPSGPNLNLGRERMAPTRTVRSKFAASKSEKSNGSKKSSLGSSGIKKSKPSKGAKAPPPKQQKTRPTARPTKRKRRVYTEKELGLPKLNTITPVGVDLPKGKKKGKIFVDDQESMMTILAIVNANKEGQIESKMMKSRQMEEIREARRKEAEVRQEQRHSKLEERKDSIRRKRNMKTEKNVTSEPLENKERRPQASKSGKKRVSFA
ncbi:60S ribosomal subunit assembly/export protein [Xanthoria parietina]